jgi:hypothetical protein
VITEIANSAAIRRSSPVGTSRSSTEAYVDVVAIAVDRGTPPPVVLVSAHLVEDGEAVPQKLQSAAQLCAEPLPPPTAPLRITADGVGSVPKVYLGSHYDRVLPWWFPQKMSKGAGARLIELGGDHSPFLSTADDLVAHLFDDAKGI